MTENLAKATNLSTIEVAAKSSCGGNTVPKRKRVQHEHTEDWRTIQHYTLWPEQTAYELLRPVVLFGDPAGKRAQETGAAERTLDRKADAQILMRTSERLLPLTGPSSPFPEARTSTSGSALWYDFS